MSSNETSADEPIYTAEPTPLEDPVWPVLKKFLQPLASLKLTVALFAMSIFIVLAGTLAQVEKEIWEVVDQYFRTIVATIEVRVFFPKLSCRCDSSSNSLQIRPLRRVAFLEMIGNLFFAAPNASWKRVVKKCTNWLNRSQGILIRSTDRFDQIVFKHSPAEMPRLYPPLRVLLQAPQYRRRDPVRHVVANLF